MSQSRVMDPQLWSFVTRFRDTSGNYNLSSQLSPHTGTFRIERDDIEQFWNLYCERLQGNPSFLSGIGQKPYEYLPLLVDVDLSIKYNPDYDMNEKLYTEYEVKTIIKVYNSVLKDICKTYKRNNCSVLLLEKVRPYRDGDKIKGGFHLHFPKLWFRRCDHDIHIYPRVNRILSDEYPGLFSKVNEQNTGELVDKGVMNKQWLIYGSSKSEKSGSYRFTKSYDNNANEISIENALADVKIYNVDDEVIDYSTDPEFYLPRILSIHASSNQDIVSLKTNLECAAKLCIPTAKEKTIQHENINVSDAVKIAAELMPMLSASRADSYETWMDIGWAFYCIGDGCQEALELWIQFSQKTTKTGYFDETYCIKTWSGMISKGKSLGTLKHYAKTDSPEQYEQWCRKKASSHVKEVIDGGHEGYANMLYDLYSNVYCTGCLEPKVQWFEYKDHHWKRIEGGHTLRQKINDDITEILKKEKAKVYIEMGTRLDNNEDDNNEQENKVVKNIDKNIKQLNNVPFKNSIMSACTYKFYKEDFINKLDSDKNLLGFSNGVLDVKNLVFRPGVPEDYITLSTGYEFKEFDMSDPDVLEVQDFLMKIFPDEDLRTYFIEYAAGLLRGGNTRKTFVVMSGVGDNGKSVLIEMIEQALGKYSIKLPTSLIVGKRTQSSQASPELARTHGVRFAVLQEPDGKDVINQGILKELTGNDTFYNRTLFKEGTDITPMFKLCLICVGEDTPVSLACGVSVSVKNLKENSQNVVSWNSENKGLVSTAQTMFMDKGMRECIELTLQDERKIICTPDHKFLTSKGEWMEAQNIIDNETILYSTFTSVCYDEIFEYSDQVVEFDGTKYFLNNIKDKYRFMEKISEFGRDMTWIDPDLIFTYPIYIKRAYVAGFFSNSTYKSGIELKFRMYQDLDKYSYILELLDEFEIDFSATDKNIYIIDTIHFMNNIGILHNSKYSYFLSIICSFYKDSLHELDYDDYDKIIKPYKTQSDYIYKMSVITKKSVGVKHVYDISVTEPYSSFVANGVVTHNCNKLPRLSDSDPATWNRIRVLPFESRFPKDSKEVPKILEEQMATKVFPRDPLFNEKIPRLKYAFMWLMLQTLKKIDKYGLYPDPEKVSEATSVYRKNNDVFLQYISENIKVDSTNKCTISLSEVYVNFCMWYRDSFPNMKVPVKNELKEDLLKRWGPHNDNIKWIGYKIRDIRDDIEDSRAILIKSEHLAQDGDELEIDPEEIDDSNTHKGKLI